ncbi:MAG: DUF6088 family protein [Bacteroidales bacterium]|nr:DUF6088 family protein [Bacteroidales bacterium]
MTNKIAELILIKIKKARRGTLFFGDDFISKGNSEAVRKALQRLVKSGELVRIATGIYVRPEIDPVIGQVTPGIEAIAKAIARRDKARIIPTGVYALNRLGLSTQVSMNLVYLTDGAARKVKVGNRTITFKKATPKNVSAIGAISSLVIQALKTIGKDKATPYETEKIQLLLKKEKITHLQHDIRLAPEWIRQIMQQVINDDKE